MMTQLYFHDTITTPDGARWLLEIYISPAPDAADEPDPSAGGELSRVREPAPQPAARVTSLTDGDWSGRTDAENFSRMIERFDGRPETGFLAEAYRDLLKEESRRELGAGGPAARIDADLAAVANIADDLIDDGGAPVWGAQSRIADALGVTNAGASNRARILAVLEALAGDEEGKKKGHSEVA